MIREATSSDAQAIADIYNYYIHDTVITFEEDALRFQDIVDRIENVKKGGFSWLVAEENGRVVGYAYAIRWHGRAAYKYTAEVIVYLSHSTTSGGWGSKLYNALFDKLRSNSFRSAIACIALPNPASVALHEKFGMEKVAHFKEVGYKFGEWIDVGYWQVQL